MFDGWWWLVDSESVLVHRWPMLFSTSFKIVLAGNRKQYFSWDGQSYSGNLLWEPLSCKQQFWTKIIPGTWIGCQDWFMMLIWLIFAVANYHCKTTLITVLMSAIDHHCRSWRLTITDRWFEVVELLTNLGQQRGHNNHREHKRAKAWQRSVLPPFVAVELVGQRHHKVQLAVS